ncbi:thiamine pyrophosphate-dependent enzyme [Opitutus terrae]|uniref:Indolepyruvate oxidoreductase subunit IorA n=1 Tax=Opitutus terrae (strain DSM 11246 / JCM 15787 / PB90-1) TaxID=452637 RepID=B1ZPA1_OPITP|nr:thiamine pyrophosphate-dependent enzyme [Opitutus terrae]ACB77590.1 Indolepyruvate ferredoxin oxidoreductase [Opitutus terrae PB90-1]
MTLPQRQLLSGDEAIALAALRAGVTLGTGYPGTPSTEILETFQKLGGPAQWAPNEKVALEVGVGVAFARGRALVTMKHVGLNVAADVLFTVAYSGVSGALVIVSADDPGMSSSQNEQDNRRYAVAAGVPMLEPADSQEAYEQTFAALEISQRWGIPVILRLTTRVCHSKTIVVDNHAPWSPAATAFEPNIRERVMIPAHARPAHRRLREKLAQIEQWAETAPLHNRADGDGRLGIITSGIVAHHAREAAPHASILQLGLTYPLPLNLIRDFVASVQDCIVLEEGDPYLEDALRAAGLKVRGRPAMYRFGEFSVPRVRRILAGDVTPETAPPRGKPPQLCPGCPYRTVFDVLRKLDCIVAGDIGCYTLGALPPFEAMHTQICMGASLGVGLGLRHALPADQARRVVSLIGDSTFMHSGLTGLAEMVYNPPATGHVLLILDNGTTAMTGQQEHPGTGRTLNHEPTGRVSIEAVARAMGVNHVDVIDQVASTEEFETLLRARLAEPVLSVIIARRNCILAAAAIRGYENAAKAATASCCSGDCGCNSAPADAASDS